MKTYVWIGGLIVVAILAVLFFKNGSGSDDNALETDSQNYVEETSGIFPVSGGTALQTQTYSQLVAAYAGRRIEFDARCQVTPEAATYKSGTKVMFDNRSGDARPISIGGVSYSFPGYGYKILTLSSGTLPKTLSINCGSAVNVGKILLQN